MPRSTGRRPDRCIPRCARRYSGEAPNPLPGCLLEVGVDAAGGVEGVAFGHEVVGAFIALNGEQVVHVEFSVPAQRLASVLST